MNRAYLTHGTLLASLILLSSCGGGGGAGGSSILLGLAFAACTVCGTVQAAGARLYSYDLSVANSLTATTVAVP